jgi:hypothetical protein
MAYPQIRSSITSAYNSTDSSTVVCSHPTGLTAGDLMILFVTFVNSGGDRFIVTPNGWTLIQYYSYSGNRRSGAAYKKIATSGDVSAGSTTVTFRESDGDPRLVENNIYAMFAVTGAASGSEITLSEQDELGGLGNVTFNFTTALTPIVDESLVFAAFIPFDFNLSTALTGSGYSLTPSSSMTERVDIGYRDGSSDGQSLMIATTEYSGRTQITSRSVTISETITSGIGSIIFLVNAPQSATATNAVFQTSPVTFATLTGSTQNATSDFTEISPDFPTQSGRGTTPTQWSNESKPSTDWSNET